MPDVIVNTSPLQFLHQIGKLDLLPAMYGHITVPEAVLFELDRGIAGGIDLPLLAAAEVAFPDIAAGVAVAF